MHPLDPFGFGRPGFERHARLFRAEEDKKSLSGLVVAITGANGGLGLAASMALATRGATVFMLCRDRARGEAAAAQVRGDVRVEVLDVARRESRDSLVLPALDVLVHNAGALHGKREEVEGLETTVATHLVGPFLLSRRLQSRHTIWVSSGGGLTQKLDVAATFDPPGPFDGVTAYARNKRAQLVVARRLGHSAMHPGWADTGGVSGSLPAFHRLTRSILRSPAQGADTIVWLAAQTPPPPPNFWFDRQIVPENPLPWTRSAAGEEDRLMARLEGFVR
jgi:NAD(P)-dependent dehydrogenase (short-subunit alcohol dehydrogenase family)